MVNTVARRRIIPVRDQLRRSSELDAIRLTRGLTAAEQDEAERLAHRAYMRAWHAAQAVTERRIAGSGR